jgi:coproporphyrinogen III oxidase
MSDDPPRADSRKSRTARWFAELRDRLTAVLEAIEDEYAHARPDHGPTPHGPAPRFARKPWSREGGGGGEMALLHGTVFEKAGVNISTVFGELAADFRGQILGAADDPRFWASGISVVVHPRSPLIPAAHMNTRHISTTKSWFGGGADLTPIYPVDADTKDFHRALERACAAHGSDYYPRFKQWCDEYFFLKHRDEARGVGGIFFDYHDTGDFERDFAFTRAVGEAFLDIYPALARRHLLEPWTEEQRDYQLMRRGRYVEFNLLYDRGTLFGLKTGGNAEAILMSLPPEVRWP